MPKPDLCYLFIAHNPKGRRIVIVKRGELDFFDTDLDRDFSASEDALQRYVDQYNERLGCDKLEAVAMKCGSMFGWHTAAADSSYMRRTVAEANAHAAQRRARRSAAS